TKEDKAPKSSAGSELPTEYFRDLFDDLKNLRTAFARSENVPPYVVFSDATLVEMSAYLPQNESEMKRISGVGDLKWQKYGADFLNEIRNYCGRNNLSSRIDLKSSKPEPQRKTRTKKDANGFDTYSTTLDMFQSGLSIEEVH